MDNNNQEQAQLENSLSSLLAQVDESVSTWADHKKMEMEDIGTRAIQTVVANRLQEAQRDALSNLASYTENLLEAINSQICTSMGKRLLEVEAENPVEQPTAREINIPDNGVRFFENRLRSGSSGMRSLGKADALFGE